MYGGADGSFNGGSATGGKGWGGLLKSVTKTAATLGKKGLKAAQVRLYVCAEACSPGLELLGGAVAAASCFFRVSSVCGARAVDCWQLTSPAAATSSN